MTLASFWELSGTFLTVLTPLAAVSLTVIIFYLRSIREHQMSWHSQWVRRLEAVEASATELRRTVGEFERDYTTKEEWLRECMHARRKLEQVGETVVRLETLMESATERPFQGRLCHEATKGFAVASESKGGT